MTDIETKRRQIRCALEGGIKEAIFDIGPEFPSVVEQIFDDWVLEEDGNIALDRLITLIMH